MIFKLVEKTHGPWMGRVWRCEEMTQLEADKRNKKIDVMKWEPCDEEQSEVLQLQILGWPDRPVPSLRTKAKHAK